MLKVGVFAALGLLGFGVALITLGGFLIFGPAALIVVGVAAIAIALFALEV